VISDSLATDRLILRNLMPEDATGAYLRWMNDPEVTRYLESRFRSFSREDLADFIKQCNADPSVLLYGICLREDGRHVGNIKIGPLDSHHRIGDVGIALGDPAVWGRGYAREAIVALVVHGFGRLGLHKITAGIYASNVGSRRAFLAAGFVEEGLRKDHYWFEGRWEDAVLMGKLSGAT
jgi:RimJ/RimL family protein N-acetyltransferase